MASSTEEHTVRELGSETQVRTAPREPTTKSALEHFQEYRRERQESWLSGASALASY